MEGFRRAAERAYQLPRNATAAIDQMMLRGQWMGEAGNFQSSILASDAYKDAQREANERLGHLLNRL